MVADDDWSCVPVPLLGLPDVPAVKRSVYCAVLALLAGLMALVF